MQNVAVYYKKLLNQDWLKHHKVNGTKFSKEEKDTIITLNLVVSELSLMATKFARLDFKRAKKILLIMKSEEDFPVDIDYLHDQYIEAKVFSEEENKVFYNLLTGLVNAHILCYTTDNKVTWHSVMAKDYINKLI